MVIKLGTSTLTGGSNKLDRAMMLEIVRAVAALRRQGVQVAVVSSGAIATGREFLNYPNLPPEISSKQMLAAVGQVYLIAVWENLFSIYGLRIGQLLLTRADLEDRGRYLNARDTLDALLSQGVVPVINENDALSTAEIKVGDNDNLAALTGVLIEAEKVILLTDQKGLYTADPRDNPKASLIRRVDKIDDDIIALAGGSGTSLGTGGMMTKLSAAKTATDSGVEVIIADGNNPQQIPELVEGRGEGTFFTPSGHPVLARKSWIGTATRTLGCIIVDDGAKKALRERGSSLLPKGITGVEDEFERAATVLIKDKDGAAVARGLCRYGSADIRKIAGRHSWEIEKILGFTRGDVVVHRDDLVLM